MKKKLFLEKKRGILLIGIFLIVLINFLVFWIYELSLSKIIIILILDVFLFSLVLFLYKKPSLIREKKKEIILLLVIIVLFFLVFEVVLRVNHCAVEYEYFPGEEQYKYYPNKMMCNKFLDEYLVRLNVNSEGFIDDNFSMDKDNIFLLGDSFSACANVEYENCVHRKLEKDFKELHGEQIDVLNFGIPGYSGLSELAILKKYGNTYKPKLVIAYFLPQNDLKENIRHLNYEYDSNYKEKQLFRRLSPKSIAFFIKGIEDLVQRVLEGSELYRLRSKHANVKAEYYEVYLKDYNEEWENLMEIQLNAFSEMKKITDELNSTLLIVITNGPEQVSKEEWERVLDTFPSLRGREYNLEHPNEIVKSFLDDKNIYNLDLLPSFKENSQRLHWKYDSHWNNEGQIFASELIKDYIIKNGIIKENKSISS